MVAAPAAFAALSASMVWVVRPESLMPMAAISGPRAAASRSWVLWSSLYITGLPMRPKRSATFIAASEDRSYLEEWIILED